jgi:hypothetical protein
LALFLQTDGGAGTGAAPSPGFGELAEMMSNIGPVAIFVLVAAAAGQPLLVDGDSGQDFDVQQGDRAEPEIHSRVPQGDAAAGDCGADRRLQREPAGAGF